MTTRTELQHQTMVAKLSKPGVDIVLQLDPRKADLWHHATGQSGEAGELLDAIKKHVIYDKPIDRANVVEELGDLEFYLEGIRANLGIQREETLVANMKKLLTGKNARYAEGIYSDQQAQARADKGKEE
jgi:NTP pyrophosphatase (non-canonical NTP hydrolase)